mmetsp:Transcript_85806/g.220873  ORF Transcript_85806/g.220873 Transcript_85806/m.220873 type:complete len:315 (-) Transcript_85806:118-1062(-)
MCIGNWRLVRANAVPHIEAELSEVHAAMAILVDAPELLLALLPAEMATEMVQALRELVEVERFIFDRVDLLEDLVQLAEPEEVEQEGPELLLADLVVAVLVVLLEGLREGARLGLLAVHPGRPHARLRQVFGQHLDLVQVHVVVAVPVDLPPELRQAPLVRDARVAHLVVQRLAELDERVVGCGDLHALDVGILLPAGLVAARPGAFAAGRVLVASLVAHVRVARGAVVERFADDPARLAGVKEVHPRERVRNPEGPVAVLTVRLIGAVDEPVLASAARDLQGLRATASPATARRPRRPAGHSARRALTADTAA